MYGNYLNAALGKRRTWTILFFSSLTILLIYVSNTDRYIPFKYEPGVRNNLHTDSLISIDLNAVKHMQNLTHASYIKELKNPCWFDPEGSLHCLPYFFLAGSPKCASTDLFLRITLHFDVIRPLTKEPHWWTRHRFGFNTRKKPTSFKYYTKQFSGIADFIEEKLRSEEPLEYVDQLITGDGSMSTLWDNDGWPKLPENAGALEPLLTTADYVHHVLPNAKIILILRNPTDRLYSDHLYFSKKIKSPDIFHDLVTDAIELYTRCFHNSSIRSCVYNETLSHKSRVRIRIGLYSVFIEDWLKPFPMKQLHVLRTEDYAKEPLTELRRIFDFLELSPMDGDAEEDLLRPNAANTRKKGDKAVGSMLPETRKILSEFYGHFNENLSVLLNDSKYLWDD